LEAALAARVLLKIQSGDLGADPAEETDERPGGAEHCRGEE